MSSVQDDSAGQEANTLDADALRSRITLVEDRVVLFREVRRQTPRSINVMFDRMEELIAPWTSFVEVLDLRGVDRPDSEARKALLARMRLLHPRVAHLSVAVGASVLLRAVARVFAVTLGIPSASFHNTLEEALDAGKEAARA